MPEVSRPPTTTVLSPAARRRFVAFEGHSDQLVTEPEGVDDLGRRRQEGHHTHADHPRLMPAAPTAGFWSAIPGNASDTGSARLVGNLILTLPRPQATSGPCLSGRGRAAFFEPRAFGDGQTGVADQRVVPFGARAPEVDGAPPRLVEFRVAAVSAQPRRRAESKARIVGRPFSHVTKDSCRGGGGSPAPVRSRDTSRLNHDRGSGILIRAKALAFRPRPPRGRIVG
jgi:hypothetical protein